VTGRGARAIAVVAALAVGLVSCGGRESAKPGAQAPAAGHAGRKILYWRSSMDPSFVSKTPGKDSMGMDLVPVYEGEETGGPPGSVRIDPATVQNIGIETMTIERRKLSQEIRTVGRIAYDEAAVRTISPKIGGWVEHQRVNFAGQLVKRNEPLLEIYSPDLVTTQEEYLLALRYRKELRGSDVPDAAEGGASLVRAAETRLRYWDISDAQIRRLRQRGAITRTMTLHAPFTGIVVDRMVLEGGHVQPGQALYRIADLSTVWVYADVYSYEIPRVAVGQKATMTLPSDPGVAHSGVVDFVYPYLKNKTRTLEVRMEFQNTGSFELKPDMWGDVVLRTTPLEGLAVPVQAVLRTGKRNLVFLALGDGRFAPREVDLGPQVGDAFEVLGGLHEGDRIVTSGQFLINSESSLQSAIGKMLEPMAPAGQPSAPAAPPGHE
jgi:Cu(I)/Ag(I) efflux system membrane fusion protein